ncbi:FAD:protein FMN transferase [Thiosocius teredinicola]|uniref:FAD:protein FMN transferase n=1 Tax=Thiosocius teredinicola TaxID=1973002 RepID=UPI00099136E2
MNHRTRPTAATSGFARPCGRRNRLSIAALLVVLGISLTIGGCADDVPEVAELTGPTMGTTFSIKISPPPEAALRDELQRQIHQRLHDINAQMSTYQPDTDLMRFNLASTTDWHAVPRELVDLVDRANTISQLSGGAYDVTVGPLVNLWGFGNAGRRDTPPAHAEIAKALATIGFQKLHTRPSPPALKKDVAGLQVDLSSIAKGWAVDQVAELLNKAGMTNYLVEIGGEVVARGHKSDGSAWRIAVEKPLLDQRAVERVVALNEAAMATSGDYRNFFTDGGRLYSHTIDPKTGETLRHRLASVTVFADNCTDADAWATALMALGEQRAPALADAQQLKAFFIIRTDSGFEEIVSPALRTSELWAGAQ